MTKIKIRDMKKADEYFVGTCSHVSESEEIDACAERRLAWFREQHDAGLRIKVALLDGEPAGFLHLVPIEISPWGPLGRDLMTIPCLYILQRSAGRGVGASLLREAKQEARWQKKKGLATIAYYHNFWFMPARYFERLGFSAVQRRGNEGLLCKIWDETAETPTLLHPAYQFEPIPDKVVVDLFWNMFCLTSNSEAQRVREVAAEYGDTVVLREYRAEHRPTLLRFQRPRGIHVNGKEIGWGYEAPKQGIRDAIDHAFQQVGT